MFPLHLVVVVAVVVAVAVAAVVVAVAAAADNAAAAVVVVAAAAAADNAAVVVVVVVVAAAAAAVLGFLRFDVLALLLWCHVVVFLYQSSNLCRFYRYFAFHIHSCPVFFSFQCSASRYP